jgi:hypothetical protein
MVREIKTGQPSYRRFRRRLYQTRIGYFAGQESFSLYFSIFVDVSGSIKPYVPYLLKQVDTVLGSIFQGTQYFMRIYAFAEGIFYDYVRTFDSEKHEFNVNEYRSYIEPLSGGTDFTQVYDQIFHDTEREQENPSLGAIILSDFEGGLASYYQAEITKPLVLGLIKEAEREITVDMNKFATPKSSILFINTKPEDANN